MNDFDWDVLQKKRTASGARHIKRGSKSKKCSLPSDYLTAAQRRRMNGEVETYNLSDKMDWKEFKSLRTDLKEEYMSILVRKYDAGLNMAAKDLFNVSNAALHTHLKNLGLAWPKTNHWKSKLGSEKMSAWYEFCGLKTNDEQPEDVPDENSIEPPAKRERVLSAAELVSGAITLKGSAPDVASRLVTLLGVRDVWTVKFEFTKES